MASNAHLGGRYEARLNEDGSLDVFDVPIVSELEKGERHDLPEFEITAEWLRTALQRATRRAAEGYLPPLHIHHHEDGNKTASAGFFKPRRVGDFDLDGKRVQTLFADLLRVPKQVADQIMAGRLPYRSIEILNVKAEPEVDSLALLDSEPPQFRYPLLSIGKLTQQGSASLMPLQPGGMSAHPTAAVAFGSFASIGAVKALFRFPRTGGIRMADEKDEKKDTKFADEGGPGGGVPQWVDHLAGTIVSGVDSALSRHFELHYTRMQANAAAPKADALGDGVLGDEEDTMISKDKGSEDDKLDAKADDLPKDKKDEDEGDAKKLAAAAAAGKPNFIDPTLEDRIAAKAIKAVSARFTRVLATSQGEIDGLKAQLAARDKKDATAQKNAETAAMILDARRKLRSVNLDEETLDTALPAQAAFGKEALDSYVSSLLRVAPKDPASTFESFVGESSASEDPTVTKFVAARGGGTETRAMAARLKKTWEENSRLGRTNMTLDRWLACNESLFTESASA